MLSHPIEVISGLFSVKITFILTPPTVAFSSLIRIATFKNHLQESPRTLQGNREGRKIIGFVALRSINPRKIRAETQSP